ncbi:MULTISPECIES: hypothetical protein [Desulfitobacterium]|uniref:Uncharacterized protein n=1 Tax=Desulfitobacterium dehalogenans (strain ATCC 51507 / DSM 9161 / JW/IU-DC1) TaxID=756499 RepID=I4A4G4_DESDJ|nr:MULTISPECIES: hypothetical protein [Desulfitobacterium]AFL98848.1 hypothetical protein Desde_0380 [Desulfitobacterium dehalogenans ATCC 51507]
MLKGSYGDEFSLRIVGYEFPDMDNDLGFDSNWLIVEVHCKHGEKTWVKRDPSLLTWEVGILIKWLRDILYKQPGSEVLEFIEPNLLFQVLRGEDEEIQTLQVTLGHETCPDWVRTRRKPAYFSMDFPINPEDIETLCKSLESDLLVYPRRLQGIKGLEPSPRDRLRIVKKDKD